MWEHKKQFDPIQAEILELEDNLAQTRLEMAQAYAGFNAVSDGDLIESYVYEIQALRARYSYLLRRRKALDKNTPAKLATSGGSQMPEQADEPALHALPIHPALPLA